MVSALPSYIVAYRPDGQRSHSDFTYLARGIAPEFVRLKQGARLKSRRTKVAVEPGEYFMNGFVRYLWSENTVSALDQDVGFICCRSAQQAEHRILYFEWQHGVVSSVKH